MENPKKQAMETPNEVAGEDLDNVSLYAKYHPDYQSRLRTIYLCYSYLKSDYD